MALSLLAGLSVLVACEGSESTGAGDPLSSPPPFAATELPAGRTALCREAMLGDPGREWTQGTTRSGPLALFGDGRDFHSLAFQRQGGAMVSKLPALVRGAERVELSVPPEERDRITLHYGRLGGLFGWSSGSRRVALEPCADRYATSFPGGIAIRGRAPVELRVEVVGETEPRTITIGRV